ncbi:MAG TPA: hypothetical protein VGK87_14215 [Anaerolineae bacterium]|jgi:hypothetical protein
MTLKNLSRRNRIILYVITIMIIFSMVISAIASFTPVVSTGQQQSVPLVRITATTAP